MAIAAPTQLATISSNTAAQTTWATGSITFPAGTWGILLMHVSGGSTASFTVSDGTNTWNVVSVNQVAGAAQQIAACCDFYYASGFTGTVTATFSSSNERFGWCGYTTGTIVNPRDAQGTNTASTGTSIAVTSSGNLTTDNEIVLEAAGAIANTAWSTFPGSNYTSLFAPTDATRSRIGGFAYRILAGGGGSTTTTDTVSWSVTAANTGAIITGQPLASGFVDPFVPLPFMSPDFPGKN